MTLHYKMCTVFFFDSRGCCAIWDIHLKLTLNSNLATSGSSTTTNRFSFPIVSKFGTEHGNTTAVLCARFQNDWAIMNLVMGQRDFVRFGFEMSFGWISHIGMSLDRLMSSTDLSLQWQPCCILADGHGGIVQCHAICNRDSWNSSFGSLLLTDIEIRTCVRNYIHSFPWDSIAHPYPDFSSLEKPPLKIGHGWAIRYQYFMGIWLLFHALNSILI